MRVVIETEVEIDVAESIVAAELYYLAGDIVERHPLAAKFLRCAAIAIEPDADQIDCADRPLAVEHDGNVVPLFQDAVAANDV
jgi:hypothetical protein